MLGRILTLAVLGLFLACGGQRVGDEGYFAGEPLPPPEKPKPKPVVSAASSASGAGAAPSAASGPSCDNPPPGGFPKCNAQQSNTPCIAPGIGECFLRCGTDAPRSVPCPQTSLPGP